MRLGWKNTLAIFSVFEVANSKMEPFMPELDGAIQVHDAPTQMVKEFLKWAMVALAPEPPTGYGLWPFMMAKMDQETKTNMESRTTSVVDPRSNWFEMKEEPIPDAGELESPDWILLEVEEDEL